MEIALLAIYLVGVIIFAVISAPLWKEYEKNPLCFVDSGGLIPLLAGNLLWPVMLVALIIMEIMEKTENRRRSTNRRTTTRRIYGREE